MNLNKHIKANLDQAIRDKNINLIRMTIVTAGHKSFIEARAAFEYVKTIKYLKVIVEHAPTFELKAKSEWTKDYFFEVTQRMLRNFSEQTFQHYLEVGTHVFPENMKALPDDYFDDANDNESPADLPAGAKIKREGGVNLVFIGAVLIGFLLLGTLIYLVA